MTEQENMALSSDEVGERADILESLRQHRAFLVTTANGLTDDQARLSPTVSSLTVGGLIKHVAATEAEWVRFIREGPADEPDVDWENIDWSNPPAQVLEHQNQFTLLEDETLEGVLARYAEVAEATDALVQSVDLDARQPLPEAPWFAPGASRSHRRTFLHVIAETAQHAGHADVIREAIDGAKTMG